MNDINTLPSNWFSLTDDQKYKLTLETRISRLTEKQSTRPLRGWEVKELESLKQKLSQF